MSFSDIKGHDRAIQILKENIKHSRLGHAYLFCGPESIGKKSSARTLAKAINCSGESVDSCDKCTSCLKVEKNQHPDVHLLDDRGYDSIDTGPIDTASIKIEDIRNLQKDAFLRPYEGKTKVFIIDNAHNLTPEAANALLKILEEPPKNSLIILTSSKPAVLFKTIISRCRILKFSSLPGKALADILKKDYNIEENLAHFLGFFCEGRLGLALRLRKSDVFNEKNRLIDEFCLANSPSANTLNVSGRQEMRSILNILAVWFRDVYILKGAASVELINLDRKDDLLKMSRRYSFDELDKIISLISDSLLYLEQNINTKLLLSNLKWALK